MGAVVCAQGKLHAPTTTAAPLPHTHAAAPSQQRGPSSVRTGASHQTRVRSSSVTSESSSIEAYAVMRDVVRTAPQPNPLRGHSSSQGTTLSSNNRLCHCHPKKTVKSSSTFVPPGGSIMRVTTSVSTPSTSSHEHPCRAPASVVAPLPTAAVPFAVRANDPSRRWAGSSSSGGSKKCDESLRMWLEAQAAEVHLSRVHDVCP